MDSFYVIIGGILFAVGFFALFVYFSAKKKKSAITFLALSLLSIVLGFSMATSIDNKNDDIFKKKNEYVNRDSFYELDRVIEKEELGSETMTNTDYHGFVNGGLTLEGVVYKFGAPSNVIGSDKGDKYMEVVYPSDETGYSIGLKFENSPNGFGDWILTDKYVVETDGVTLPEYTTP